MRPPGLKEIGRIAAFVAIAAAIAAAALHLAHDGTRPADHAGTVAASPEDPLARELARCRAIGMRAKGDAACAAAWTESRRRFFNYSPSPIHSAITPAASASDAKANEAPR